MLSESSDEEAEFKFKSGKPRVKKRIEGVLDLNSSFDDIDSIFLVGAQKDESEGSDPIIVFRAPMRKITFNPCNTADRRGCKEISVASARQQLHCL